MIRYLALALALLTLGCTASSAGPAAKSPIAIHVSAQPSLQPLPPPSQVPAYPPASLADVVALAAGGVDRKFVGAEGQPLDYCSRAWMRIYEPDGLTPRQEAADLLKVSIERHVLTKSCGGFIFGTTNIAYCNCYHANHGYIDIERGPQGEPSPGKMTVSFSLTDISESPSDWSVTVDEPSDG